METLWGVVLSFLFVLATLSGYNVTGPATSEQKEQLEKYLKEQKEQFEKDQKEWKEQHEKQQKEQKEQLEKQQKEQKEKAEKKENSGKKQKYEQTDKSSTAKVSKKRGNLCIDDCPDEWRLHQ